MDSDQEELAGCKILAQARADGNLKAIELKNDLTVRGPSRVFFFLARSSKVKDLCEYLQEKKDPNLKCIRVDRGIPQDGDTWDSWVVLCHFPPCLFLDNL